MSKAVFGDWEEAVKELDGVRFQRALVVEAERALNRSGLAFVALAAKAIRGKKYAPNSEVTIALKGTSTPLVGGSKGGDLLRALTYDVEGDRLVLWLGVNRMAKTSGGEGEPPRPLENIAAYLHEGFSIDLGQHPRVRAAVFARLGEAAAGKGRGSAAARRLLRQMKEHPRGAKQIWIVPARPFIGDVVESEEFGNIHLGNIGAAVNAAIGG